MSYLHPKVEFSVSLSEMNTVGGGEVRCLDARPKAWGPGLRLHAHIRSGRELGDGIDQVYSLIIYSLSESPDSSIVDDRTPSICAPAACTIPTPMHADVDDRDRANTTDARERGAAAHGLR